MMKRRTEEDYQRDKKVRLAASDGIQLENTMTIDDHIERINHVWKKTGEDYIAGIIEVGQELIAIKDKLGQSLRRMADKFPFSWQTANRLMLVSKWTDTHACQSRLPPSWMTLYELTQVPEEVMRAALEDGRINPNMTLRDAKRLKPIKVKKEKSEAKQPTSVEEMCERAVSQWGKASKTERKKVIDALMEALDLDLHDWVITMPFPGSGKGKRGRK
jgi:hypothetical protein